MAAGSSYEYYYFVQALPLSRSLDRVKRCSFLAHKSDLDPYILARWSSCALFLVMLETLSITSWRYRHIHPVHRRRRPLAINGCANCIRDYPTTEYSDILRLTCSHTCTIEKFFILSARYEVLHEQFTRLLWVALWHLHTQILCHFVKASMNNIMLIHCKLIMI